MKNVMFFRQHHFICLLFLNFVFVLLVTQSFYWHYESNDDLIMAWIASGKFLGSPDRHLVFINVVYGIVLSWLYKLLPFVEWYTLLLLTFHVLSLTIIAKWLLKQEIMKVIKLAIFVLLYLLEVRMLLSLQFTTTSGLLSTAALVLIIETRKKNLILGILLFVLASMIRFQAAMLVGLVFCMFYPLFVYYFEFSFPQFLALITCVLLSISFSMIDKKNYQSDPEWGYYYEYNKVRGRLNDNPNSWRAFDHLPQNVCKEDYKMLTWYFFPDPSVLDLNTMRILYDTVEKQTGYKSVPYIKKTKNIWYSMKGYVSYFSLLVSICLIFVFAMEDRTGRILCSFGFVGFLLIFSWISMNMFVKERAFLCAFFAFVVFILSLVERLKYRFSFVLLSWLMIIIGHFTIRLFADSKLFYKSEMPDEGVVILKEINKTPVILGELVTASLNPMKLQEGYMNACASGWTTVMPNKNGIGSYLDLVNEGIPIVISKEYYSDVVETLQTSLRFHHLIKVDPCVLSETEHYIAFCLKQ